MHIVQYSTNKKEKKGGGKKGGGVLRVLNTTDTLSSLDDPLPMDSEESSLSTVLSPSGEIIFFATICTLLALVLLHCSK